jgi:signal transduction histidine kinase
MMSMRERTELLKGDLRINSEEGKGTCVTLLVPLSDAAANRLRNGT